MAWNLKRCFACFVFYKWYDSCRTTIWFFFLQKIKHTKTFWFEYDRTITLRPDAQLRISVSNPLSGDEVRENVVFNLSETIEQDEDSREPAHHFGLKWDGSNKRSILQAYVTEAEVNARIKKFNKRYKGEKPRPYTGDDDGKWVPLLLVECRGLEPYAFHPMKDEFVITSEGGWTFDEEIEFTDNEWADYDAENDCPVSIQEIEFKFEEAWFWR